MNREIRIGTAGWSIPRQHAAEFPVAGSHLQRYAGQFSAVEINSSFYRPHRPTTYARWAAGVPACFRFAVKVPREITHTRRLVDVAEPLDRFLGEVQALEGKLGPLLIQLPPSLRYDHAVVEPCFASFRARFSGLLACEPRHETWFTDAVEATLGAHEVARVAADPAVVPRAAEPGGWPGFVYNRLHGSPSVYYSAYPEKKIAAVAQAMAADVEQARQTWCIFDNTAAGEATRNALQLKAEL
jgi:uncharacterized protein YecE (DUF72 family)